MQENKSGVMDFMHVLEDLADYKNEDMSGRVFLEKVIQTLKERQREYGSPQENFDNIATRWGLLLDIPITSKQVALMMIDLKLARLNKTPDHHDSLVDIVGYAACLSTLV